MFSAIVLEASTITTLGALLGFLVYGAILGAAFVIVRAQTGVVLDAFKFDPALWMTPIGMILLGALAGLVFVLSSGRCARSRASRETGS